MSRHQDDMDDSVVVRFPDGSHRRVRSGCMLTGLRIDAVVWVGPKCGRDWLDVVGAYFRDSDQMTSWRLFLNWRDEYLALGTAPPTVNRGPS